MSPKIVVIGSANTDMVVKVQSLPQPGETVLGGQFLVAQGGKGANQAVAAARLGAEVTFVARLGHDAFGQAAVAVYRGEHICLDYLVRDEITPSGVALIMVNTIGENLIAVAPGANSQLSPDDVLAAEDAIRVADAVLLQLEIPIETARVAAGVAKRHGVHVILNPAPAIHLPQEIFPLVDILTPNEAEAALLLGRKTGDPVELGYALQEATGVGSIVITLGSQGALLIEREQQKVIEAHPVVPVDTVAAGDAFNAALAVVLARHEWVAGQHEKLEDAVRFANAVAAVTVTRPGAQASLPTLDEVHDFLRGQMLL